LFVWVKKTQARDPDIIWGHPSFFFSLFIWLFNFITKFSLNKIIKMTCEKSFDYAIFSR
jgi:hypothetical protein